MVSLPSKEFLSVSFLTIISIIFHTKKLTCNYIIPRKSTVKETRHTESRIGSNISCLLLSGFNFQPWTPNTNYTWKVMSTVQIELSQPSGFASRCDWVIGSRAVSYEIATSNTAWGRIEILPKTVFLQTKNLQTFNDNLLPCFPAWHKFVLIIGDRDTTTPKQTDKRFPSPTLKLSDWESWLNDKRIFHLFVEHLDTASPADRVTPIPLGLNPDEFDGGNPDAALQFFESEKMKNIKERPIRMVYTNRVRGNGSGQWSDRATANRMCENLLHCDVSTSSRAEFKALIQQYPFLLCVHGGGIEPNPNTFTALLAGVIPVIAPFVGQSMYSGLPVHITDGEWNQSSSHFSLETLNDTLHKFAPFFEDPALRSTMREKLMSQYWWDKVETVLRDMVGSELDTNISYY